MEYISREGWFDLGPRTDMGNSITTEYRTSLQSFERLETRRMAEWTRKSKWHQSPRELRTPRTAKIPVHLLLTLLHGKVAAPEGSYPEEHGWKLQKEDRMKIST
jgi:hypothetical protein